MSTVPVYFLKLRAVGEEDWNKYQALWRVEAPALAALLQQEAKEGEQSFRMEAETLRLYPEEVEWQERASESVQLWMHNCPVLFSLISRDFEWPEWPPIASAPLAVEELHVFRRNNGIRLGWQKGRLQVRGTLPDGTQLESEPLSRPLLVDLMAARMSHALPQELEWIFPLLVHEDFERAARFIRELPGEVTFPIAAEIYARLLSHPDAQVRLSLIAREGVRGVSAEESAVQSERPGRVL